MTEIYIFAGLYIVCSIVKNLWWFKMVISYDNTEPDDKFHGRFRLWYNKLTGKEKDNER